VKLGHRKAGFLRRQAARVRGRSVAGASARSVLCLAGVTAAGVMASLAVPSAGGAVPLGPGRTAEAPATRTVEVLATSAPARHDRPASGVSLSITSQYRVTVPPGTWVPVTLSATNGGASDVQGNVLVQAPVTQEGLATAGCLSNGPSTFTCISAEDYSSSFASSTLNSTGLNSTGLNSTGLNSTGLNSTGLNSTGLNSTGLNSTGLNSTGLNSTRAEPARQAPSLRYTVPLELAAGTVKQITLYLLTGPPGAGVSAQVEGPTGRVLARATTALPVAYGLAAPAVMVVTNSPASVSVMSKLLAPTGAQPQLQYASPSALPSAPAALGAFRAILIDQADTSAFSPGQRQALDGYVSAGGTLVVAGGLDWRGPIAGLPAALLPAHPTGAVAVSALPDMARLLGIATVPRGVDVDSLAVSAGGVETLVEGKSTLALQLAHGRGHVVLCAFDPAAAPLSNWPGAPALLSRLFAPAFQPGYYDSALPYAEGGGVFPVPPSNVPAGVVARLGGNFDTGSSLLSPATAAGVLASYLGQAPAVTRPPAVGFIGLLLAGYIALVGLVLLAVFRQHRRRAVVWAAVPTLALTAVLAASLAGVGTGSRPLVDEVRVSQLTPGDHVAQVLSLGMVQLPRGGARRIDLAGSGPAAPSPGLVGNLAAGSGADVTVSQPQAPSATSVTVSGPPKARGGWSASETVHLPGTVRADVTQQGGVLLGKVRNDLGVPLADAEVVLSSGEAFQELGTLRSGRSAQFQLAVSPSSSPWPQAFGAPVPIPPDQAVAVPDSSGRRTGATSRNGPAKMGPRAATAAEARAEKSEVEMALGDLAASYSTQQGGAPVFVAMAAHKLFPLDAGSGGPSPAVTDVVVVPFSGHENPHLALYGIPGELVGSSGVTGETEYAVTTGSLTLEAGGAFDYQFFVPGTKWSRLELDLGSASGETYGPALVGARAYNYSTNRWDSLRVAAHKGELLAPVPDASSHLGPGGTVEVQVVADQNGVEVYGGFPTLSATPLSQASRREPNPLVQPARQRATRQRATRQELRTTPYALSPRPSGPA
jgi:hypothetical protein